MYFNTLIIMNEDAQGYGNRSRKPSGYCKLTMPNRLICYVQGLKQLPKGQIYRLYLTSKARQQSVEVGMFQVGPSGSKETRWVMDSENVNNSGMSAQEIDGALIVVDGEDIKNRIVPLVGFSTEAYTWEHLLRDDSRPESPEPPKVIQASKATQESKQVEVVEPKKEAQVLPLDPGPKEPIPSKDREAPDTTKPAEPPKPVAPLDGIMAYRDLTATRIEDGEPSEVLSLKEEIKSLNRTLKESKEIIAKLEKDLMATKRETQAPLPQELDPNPEIELEKTTGINDYINSFIRKFQTTEKKQERATCEGVQDIFEQRIPINPFETQNTGIKWVRITQEDLMMIPSLGPKWTNQPLVTNAYKDYKHFILGRDQSKLTYYLGIPGIYDPSENGGLNIDKIEKFACCHNVLPRVGEAGYWIVRL